jgi:hypothetical protein
VELIAILVALFFVARYLGRRRHVVSEEVPAVGSVGWTSDLDWRVIRPLARADLRRVLLHPVFLVGVVLTPLMLVAATEDMTRWREISAYIALALVPLGWFTIIATNLVALRPRRTGADELFSVLPAGQPIRTAALLATMIGPVAIAAVFGAAAVAAIRSQRAGLSGSPEWAEIAAGLLIVAGSVCVGVGVARWLPRAGFGPLAVVATMLIQARFLDVTTWPWNRGSGDPMRFLGFLAEPAWVSVDFLEVRPTGWHLLYVAGLVIVMAGVALAREGLARPVLAILGTGVLIAGGAGFAQTRPMSGDREDEMLALLTDPAAHLVCEDAGSVRYCAYADFVGDIARWDERVGATLAALPSDVGERGQLEVIQRPAIIVGDHDCRPAGFERGLPPGVAARLTPSMLWPADRHVHPPFGEETFPCSDRDGDGFFLAVQTGAWATGLPPAPHEDDRRCTASGQARAAIALWAGATASPDGARTLGDVMRDGVDDGGSTITFTGWDGPPMWGVDYAVADAEVALAMLDLPDADVRSALGAEWDRWIDPATTTEVLTDTLGLPRPVVSSGAPDDDCA